MVWSGWAHDLCREGMGVGCGHIDGGARMAGEAELIFTGGAVVTVDPENRVVEAVATRGDRIVYVGDAAGAAALRGPTTRVVELKGRTLVPGLIEAHCHVAGVGAFQR